MPRARARGIAARTADLRPRVLSPQTRPLALRVLSAKASTTAKLNIGTAIARWMPAMSTLFGPEAGSFSPTKKDKEGKPKFVPAWNWRSTTAPNRIYIELFKWPSGTFHLDRVPRNVIGGFLLADASKRPLKITKSASSVDIELPKQATDPIATVLVLETT
jgi:hypothetical protein